MNAADGKLIGNKKHVIIVSGLQLCDNPRVVKEADTLSAAGYQVTVLAAQHTQEGAARNATISAKAQWHPVFVVNSQSDRLLKTGDWILRRLFRRLVNLCCRISGTENIAQVSYCAGSMLRFCLRHPAELYIVHVDAGIWVGSQLIKRGLPVAADLEDWHSQDLRIADRIGYPSRVIQSAEETILTKSVYVSTTSHALADALKNAYNGLLPIGLQNAFRKTERCSLTSEPRGLLSPPGLPRIGWVSQVIGPDRGLEQLIAATHHIKQPIEIHLTGRLRRGMDEELLSKKHSASRITFHDQVPHEQLLSLIQTYDIGFAGEIADNRNKDLTISNKILHYMLAGVPCVASDTVGQMEICNEVPHAARVYSQRNPVSLAMAIDSLLDSPETLQNAKRAAWDAGSTKFCWEANEPRLLNAVRDAIGDPDNTEFPNQQQP